MNLLAVFTLSLALFSTQSLAKVHQKGMSPGLSDGEETTQYDSGPLGQFAVGKWQRIRISMNKKGEVVLTLDPNRIEWDGYSPTWISTRMAERVVRARARELKDKSFIVGKPKTAYPLRLYDLVATDLPPGANFIELGLGNKIHFVKSDHPKGICRLLIIEGDRRRVVALDRVTTTPMRTPSQDLFSYRTTFLDPKVNRATIISISGSLEFKTAQLFFDANAMRLDAFGDPQVTTLMAPMEHKVSLVEKTDLPSELASIRVFELEGSPIPLSLVVPRSGGLPARLLVKQEDGKTIGFLLLEQDFQSALPLMLSQWRLKKIVYNNDTTFTPEKNGVYSVQFLADGHISGRASANRFKGSFVSTHDRLWLSPTGSTLALSPPGNIEAEFLKALSQVDSYKIVENELWLMIKYDSGTMIFEREPKSKRK